MKQATPLRRVRILTIDRATLATLDRSPNGIAEYCGIVHGHDMRLDHLIYDEKDGNIFRREEAIEIETSVR